MALVASSMKMKSRGDQGISADIVYEILLRLPVKSLKRFQCVEKSWFSLISSTQFQEDHFYHAQHKPRLLLTLEYDNSTFRFSAYNNEEGTVTRVSKSFQDLPEDFCNPLMQSCRGLVCIFSNRSNAVFMYNPSTQEFISLPPTTRGKVCCVGFGYATSTKEFKVVRLSDRGCHRDYSLFEIFTLGTRHWRLVETSTPVFTAFRGISPFVQGALHILEYKYNYCDVKNKCYIVAFDINTEEYRKTILLPVEHHGSSTYSMCLGKLGDHLCLTHCSREHRGYFELWFLKDYNSEEWIKRHTISFSRIISYPIPYPLVFTADSDVDEGILFNYRDHKGFNLLAYDPKDGVLTLRSDNERAAQGDNERAASFYMETFYPLSM